MPVDLWKALAAASLLSKYQEEGRAQLDLEAMLDESANLLVPCFRRLGWWFPSDDHRSAKEQLNWWLFREDVKRLDLSDGTERYRVETPDERLRDAIEGIKMIAQAVTIQADSCLAVAFYVRGVLSETGRNNPPLYRRWRRGWPAEFSSVDSSEGWQNLTDDPCFHEEMGFDEFCFRFDGELLDAALLAAATRLGLQFGRLKFREPIGHALNDELYARRDLVSWLEGWRDWLMQTAWERKELPSGWEPRDTTWPDCPIQDVEHLRGWLSSWLESIHRARSLSWGSPELYLDDVRRELRNARLAMRSWKQPLPKDFNAKPANIHDAEEQLMSLIDGLIPVGGDAAMPTVVPAELDFPLEWEFQYGTILTPLDGTFDTTANGVRLREDKVTPPHPVRNLVDLLGHVQRWASLFRTTRRELELAKEVKSDAHTIAEWTSRLLNETQRELRNARLAVDEWIDDPAQRPAFCDNPADIYDARQELIRLIDGLAAFLLALPTSPEAREELTALPTILRKMANAIASTGNTKTAGQLASNTLRANPELGDRHLLQRVYTRWNVTHGPHHELTMLLSDTLEQLAQLVGGGNKATPLEYRERLENLAKRWEVGLSHWSSADAAPQEGIEPSNETTNPQKLNPVDPPTEAYFRAFHKTVKLVLDPLRNAVNKIRLDAARSGEWLDSWQSFGLLVKDRWSETDRISNKARLYRELINANQDQLISIKYLDTPSPTWAIGDSNSDKKPFMAHQAVLAIAEKLVLDLSEMRRWNVNHTAEAERLSQAVALKAAFSDFDADDILRRLDAELKRTLDAMGANTLTQPDDTGVMTESRSSVPQTSQSIADAKRMVDRYRRLAGAIWFAQKGLPSVCDKYLADHDWFHFFHEATRFMKGALEVMDEEMRDSIPVEWNEFRVANADYLLNVEFRGHKPSTAHELIWRVGQLLGIAYDNCKSINDDPSTYDDDCRLEAVTHLRKTLEVLPFAMKFCDSLDAETARWQRWLIDAAEKQTQLLGQVEPKSELSTPVAQPPGASSIGNASLDEQFEPLVRVGRARQGYGNFPADRQPNSFVELFHWCPEKPGPNFIAEFQLHLRRLGVDEIECAEVAKECRSSLSGNPLNRARQICLRYAEKAVELPPQWMDRIEPVLQNLVEIPLIPLKTITDFRAWLGEAQREPKLLGTSKRDNYWTLRMWVHYEQAAYWLDYYKIGSGPTPPDLRKAVTWFTEDRSGSPPSFELADHAVHVLLDIADAEICRRAAANSADRLIDPGGEPKTGAAPMPSELEVGENRAETKGDLSAEPEDVRRPNGDEHPHRFECYPEIVRVYGFGESVTLERTEGVDRLMAIVTRKRVSAMELARIGASQKGNKGGPVDTEADRLAERESPNSAPFESSLGDDATFAVYEAIQELIEQRNRAIANGDDKTATELTAKINAALQPQKPKIQSAASTVLKTLKRTYERLRVDNKGEKLANHFETFVTRPRNEPEFVYVPAAIYEKIEWIVK